ncbi:MAG TPA: trypsin-like serine protease [Kofleriaceae bacterium]
MPRHAPVAYTFAVLLAACVDQPNDGAQVSQIDSAVVGGTTAQQGQWPDAVAVLGTNGTCSGTLIAPDVVLTAGHCAGINPQQVIANTVDYSNSDNGVRVHVAHVEAYPNWQSSYDAAVLVLASPIQGVKPRKLGTSCTFDRVERATAVHLVGFGATDTMGQTANTQQREAMTEVTDPECTGGNGCKKALAPGGEFVAGGTGAADSCFGDSGGPVYLDTPVGTVVIGTVSRGVDNADTPCGGGGIYVRTDKLIEWIEQATGAVVEADDCETAYSGEDLPDDVAGDEGGCSAAGGSGLGALGLVLLALLRLRRR